MPRSFQEILGDSLRIQVEQNDVLRQIASGEPLVQRLLAEQRTVGALLTPDHILKVEQEKLRRLDDQREANQRRLRELLEELPDIQAHLLQRRGGKGERGGG